MDPAPEAAAPNPLLAFLKKIPAVGPLLQAGGTSSSEFAVAAGAGAAILQLDAPGWAKAVALAVVAAGYAISRALTKCGTGA